MVSIPWNYLYDTSNKNLSADTKKSNFQESQKLNHPPNTHRDHTLS